MRDITVAENIREAVVLEGINVDIKPSGFMGEARAADEGRGGLWGHDVQHVEILSDGLVVGHVLEGSDSVIFVDSNKVVAEELCNVFAIALLSQSCTVIIIRRENDRSGAIVPHVSIGSDAILAEGRLTKIQNLLRGTTALDWECRASENSVTATEVVAKDRSLVCTLEVVHAANGRVRVIKSLLSSINQIVAELEARVDDKDVVSCSRSISKRDRVVVWVEACHS